MLPSETSKRCVAPSRINTDLSSLGTIGGARRFERLKQTVDSRSFNQRLAGHYAREMKLKASRRSNPDKAMSLIQTDNGPSFRDVRAVAAFPGADIRLVSRR